MYKNPDALTDYETRLLQAAGNRIVFMLLSTPLSYSAATAFVQCDESLGKPGNVVIYHLSPSALMDECAALAICDLVDRSQRNGRYVILSGLRDSRLSALDKAGIFDHLSQSQCFDARRTAIEVATAYCRAK